MSIISSPTQNFHAASVSGPSPARDNESGVKISGDFPLDGLRGNTPLTTGNPGFGSGSAGRFSLGEFLG